MDQIALPVNSKIKRFSSVYLLLLWYDINNKSLRYVFGTDDKHFDLDVNGLQELMQVTLLMNISETVVESDA